MMTPESDTGSPLSMSPSIQGYDPRAIIRQLLESYTKEDINRLVEEESCISPSGTSARLLTLFNFPFHKHGEPGTWNAGA